jgi:tetratricopeptide (TPR) repeat protein
VHNDYLNTLVDWGLAGAALVAAAWGALLWGALWGWRFIRRSASDLSQKKSSKSAFVLGASLGLFAFMLEAFADFNFHIPANAITAVTLMAMISSHLRFATDRFWVTQRLVGRVLATIVLGAAIVWLAEEGWKNIREQHWLGRAAAAGEDLPAQLAALERAFAIDNRDFETAYAIGENLRLQSLGPGENRPQLAADAVTWYRRSIALNPYDAYSFLRIGLCTHWLGYPERAVEWFDNALKLDPNSYFMLAHAGWHALQLGHREQARPLIERSLRLKPADNPLAEACLNRLAEPAPETPRGP